MEKSNLKNLTKEHLICGTGVSFACKNEKFTHITHWFQHNAKNIFSKESEVTENQISSQKS